MDATIRTLAGRRILIVEDEYLLADDLAQHFGGIGAQVLGPVPDVERARPLVPLADAAILDINVADGPIFPIADELFLLGTPFVFFSGMDGDSLPERFRFVGSLPKPVSWRKVVEVLVAEIDGTPSAVNPLSVSREDMAVVLPKLRLSARLLLTDGFAADRLVERTLERAVDEFGKRPAHVPTSAWLNQLMETTLASRGRDLMN